MTEKPTLLDRVGGDPDDVNTPTSAAVQTRGTPLTGPPSVAAMPPGPMGEATAELTCAGLAAGDVSRQ